MPKNHASPVDAYLTSIWKKIPAEIKTAFFSAVIIGVLVHMFMITNRYPNHDTTHAIGGLFWVSSLGRWLIGWASLISSDFNLPWINGMLAIFYLALSSCVIVSCYQIKSKVHSFLISGIIVAFPSVFITMSYIDVVDPYFLSLLLMCLSVFVTAKYKYGFVAGMLLVVISLAIFQAYLGFAFGLAIGMLILDILLSRSDNKQLLAKSIKFAAAIAGGTIIYIFITRSFFELSTYRGIDSMGELSLSQLPALIKASYTGVYEYFVNDAYYVHHYLRIYSFSKFVYALVFFTTAALAFFIIFSTKVYKRRIHLAYVLVLFAAFPLGVNVIRIMYPGAPYLLMVFSLAMLLVFPFAILETALSIDAKNRLLTSAASWIFLLAYAVSIYGYALTTNQWYLRAHYINEQGYSYSTTLITKIESLEGYSSSQAILFVGRPRLTNTVPEFNRMTTAGMPPIPMMWSYDTYLRTSHGFRPEITILHTLPKDTPFISEILEMPVYPESGAIRLMGDTVIVKFANVSVED